MKTWNNVSLEKMKEVAAEVWELLPAKGVVCFNGEMGAGKTTFINALAKIAGVTEETSSPTFSIVNEYRTANNNKLYHFDCYRIEDETEAMDFGIEEYFEDQAISLVEWPSKIESLLPAQRLEVSIVMNSQELRDIKLISVS
jgi:tRNA threonylcarbamoyladenosine biosynthesis protein TsaE